MSLVSLLLIYFLVVLDAVRVDLLYVCMCIYVSVQTGFGHFTCKIVLHLQSVCSFQSMIYWSGLISKTMLTIAILIEFLTTGRIHHQI